MTKNGYLDEEPIVVIPKDLPEEFVGFQPEELVLKSEYVDFIEDPNTEFVVVEGNRRISTIKILLSDDLREELKELRYEYITGKSDLMEASKQSNISDRLKVLGIKENTQPVKSIIIKKEE